MSWRLSAACRTVDPELFFADHRGSRPHRGRPSSKRLPSGRTEIALEICSGCPVQLECLDYALDLPAGQDFGIWGGATVTERVELRRG